jgi:hypothetical protein
MRNYRPRCDRRPTRHDPLAQRLRRQERRVEGQRRIGVLQRLASLPRFHRGAGGFEVML